MHSPGFKIDQEAMDKITNLNQELDLIELKKKSDSDGIHNIHTGDAQEISQEVAKHLITDICCRLDLIDVSGSDTLRNIRRKVLKRADHLEKLWEK